MTILPYTQQDQVKRGKSFGGITIGRGLKELSQRLFVFFCPSFGRSGCGGNSVNVCRWHIHLRNECLKGQRKITVGIIRRHAPFIAPEKVRMLLINPADMRFFCQLLIEQTRCRPTRKDECEDTFFFYSSFRQFGNEFSRSKA